MKVFPHELKPGRGKKAIISSERNKELTKYNVSYA